MAAGQAGVSGSSTFPSLGPCPPRSPGPGSLWPRGHNTYTVKAAGSLQIARYLGSEPPRRQHHPEARRCFLPLPRGPQCFHYGGRKDPNSLFPPYCTLLAFFDHVP